MSTRYTAVGPSGRRVAFPSDARTAEHLSRQGWRVRASTGSVRDV